MEPEGLIKIMHKNIYIMDPYTFRFGILSNVYLKINQMNYIHIT
jgi:hypothetical protein